MQILLILPMNLKELLKPSNNWYRIATISFGILAVLLFVYFVKRTGIGVIIESSKKLGFGFLLVMFLSGMRILVRSLAWQQCLEPPYSLTLRNTWPAYLIGDTMGQLFPLGLVVTEPVKAMMVSSEEEVPLGARLKAIAIENLFYSLSVILIICAGALALLLSFDLPPALYTLSRATFITTLIVILVGLILLRRARLVIKSSIPSPEQWQVETSSTQSWISKLSNFINDLYTLFIKNRSRSLYILFLEVSYHMMGIAEVYIILLFISPTSPTILIAFILESVNRVINVVFKFIPLRIGIDEAGSGLLSKVLMLGTASGVSLAIIRKARILCWMTVGIMLFIYYQRLTKRNVKQ
jgi:glycosyltransferase 2 family protein